MITGAVDHVTGTRDVKTWWFTNDYAYFIYNYCYYGIKVWQAFHRLMASFLKKNFLKP